MDVGKRGKKARQAHDRILKKKLDSGKYGNEPGLQDNNPVKTPTGKQARAFAPNHFKKAQRADQGQASPVRKQHVDLVKRLSKENAIDKKIGRKKTQYSQHRTKDHDNQAMGTHCRQRHVPAKELPGNGFARSPPQVHAAKKRLQKDVFKAQPQVHKTADRNKKEKTDQTGNGKTPADKKKPPRQTEPQPGAGCLIRILQDKPGQLQETQAQSQNLGRSVKRKRHEILEFHGAQRLPARICR
ncbi:MAG: hypothetical protein HQK81_00270 [Desulfovibrionaceae bacterium]|nr:hypothetical protein [Desulfovibrionaceae bacterium]MBF0512483.1 hypothetical protein [Desulfovibrionaceae bacterium]